MTMGLVATKQVVRFLAVVYVTVLVLAVANLLPQFLGGEPRGVVRYATPEAVRGSYGVVLWQPASLPPQLRGPRRLRVAVGSPDWVQMRFDGSGGDRLSVCESLEPTPGTVDVAEVLLPRGDVLQSEDVIVKGDRMRARRLLLDDGAIVHELWWRSGGRNIMLRLRGSMEELMSVARVAMETRR